MLPNKFVFLIFVQKIKARGATRSQSCASDVHRFYPFRRSSLQCDNY